MKAKFWPIALILLMPSWSYSLDCPAGAILKQSEGAGSTLHTWCEVAGRRQGPYEVFAVNGGLQIQSEFKNGKLDGLFKRFSPQGYLETQGQYSKGKMSGVWTRYWSKEQLRDQGQWKNGVAVGEWKFVDPKTGAERVVKYDAKGREEKPKDLDDRWRFSTGFMHTERYGYNNWTQNGKDTYTVDLISIDGQRRLWRWQRYLRMDLDVRLVPERLAQTDKVVVSGQLGVSLDLLRNLTGPVAIFLRTGRHLTDLDEDRFYLGLGLRYHLKRFQPGFRFGGFFAEFTYADYDNDRNNQYTGPGPGPGSDYEDEDSGLDMFFIGAFWSLF